MSAKLIETLQKHGDPRASFLNEAVLIAIEAGKVSKFIP